MIWACVFAGAAAVAVVAAVIYAAVTSIRDEDFR